MRRRPRRARPGQGKTQAMHHLVFPINALPSWQCVPNGIDEILWSADLKALAMERYYQQVDADVCYFLGDIGIQAEAMGAPLIYASSAMPSVLAPAQTVAVPRPAEVPRMKVNIEVMRRMDQCLPGKLRCAQLYGPFTVAGQIAGEENLLRMLSEDPAGVKRVLAKTFELTRRYALSMLEAGGNLFWISDPFAVLLPPDLFWEYAGRYLRDLYALFPELPTMLHICGDTTPIVADMVRTGVKGISFDNCMHLMAIEDQVPDHVAIIGNIDPVECIELGSTKDIVAQTNGLVAMMRQKDNFILSTGCALPPGTPLENVSLFVDTGKKALAAETSDANTTYRNISSAVFSGDRGGASELVDQALAQDRDPLAIINQAMVRAIRKGSLLYDERKCHLPAILLMVDAFYDGFQRLEPLLPSKSTEHKSTVILGTVKGDIHEIGKNLVRIFLEIAGYKVVDLGVNVDEDAFLHAWDRLTPDLIGLSAFTTQSRKQMGVIVDSFRTRGIDQMPFMVGGAAVTPEIARSLGAQGYAKDARQAVRLADSLLGKP